VVQKYVVKRNVTALEHPPYSLGLSQEGFFLFPRMNVGNDSREPRKLDQKGKRAVPEVSEKVLRNAFKSFMNADESV
jgi:hypothetical protein